MKSIKSCLSEHHQPTTEKDASPLFFLWWGSFQEYDRSNAGMAPQVADLATPKRLAWPLLQKLFLRPLPWPGKSSQRDGDFESKKWSVIVHFSRWSTLFTFVEVADFDEVADFAVVDGTDSWREGNGKQGTTHAALQTSLEIYYIVHFCSACIDDAQS